MATRLGQAYDSPRASTRPPSQAPKAFPMFSTAWFRAAARD